MYRIDGNEVYYKTENMVAEILYGLTPTTFPTDDPAKGCVKSFDLEVGEYVIDTTITEWGDIPVVDGYFDIEVPEPEPIETQPSNSEIYENQLIIMEALADIVEMNMGGLE